ncbi:MAG TPA: hypothetical protein VJ877_01915 [Bacteroidales bacterium]|nr:hypothetical protein [Bacteroidales bacterium]
MSNYKYVLGSIKGHDSSFGCLYFGAGSREQGAGSREEDTR